MGAASLLPADPPRTPLPPGACDCHMHAYGDPARYPVPEDAPFRPVEGGSIDAYLALRERLGLTRAVVVQPSAYGFDNRCTMDAVARLGPDGRAVVVVDESASDAELAALTAQGARGLRFFMLPGGALGWEKLAPMAARIAEHGWHIQMQMDGRFLEEREADLAHLPCPLVIDHNGKFLKPVGLDHPGLKALRRLLDGGRTWVKTSGVYETSLEGAPRYSDTAAIARHLIADYPERCVWATNWPHPSVPGSPPDDALLSDLFAQWCGSEAVRARILVENPAILYGFE
ncbi:amidohydrolase family protein [Marivibrio halodurans]|uniref:Amidohydrolase family protein n=1 Tax=Marivibrio halodurans TaxID=2039722 RepID=A0A8J7V4B3_9PROT|nr:amidohydrolase family protein [Marivibrio halodurans]MBP5857509.1 amidohydrolase family protein [Marivibrio halodurans]